MALVMVYVEISWKGNAPIYYKATVIDMENLSVAENIVVHTVTVIQKVEMKLMQLIYFQ